MQVAGELNPLEGLFREFLVIISEVIGLPSALIFDGEIISNGTWTHFEPYCKFLRSLPGGEFRCNADHLRLANMASESGVRGLTLCHAGIYNKSIPITIDNEVRAVLTFGQMQIDGTGFVERALERHLQLVEELKLDKENSAELSRLLLETKKFSTSQLENFERLLSKFEDWFRTVIEREDRLRRNRERIRHELVTRIQPIIAEAEILLQEIPVLNADEITRYAQRILHGTLALGTVVQSLGSPLPSYRFRMEPITRILEEAANIYRPEAEQRGIEIRVSSDDMIKLEFSRDHLQIAINNLVHNAVKYSFRSRTGSPRYVRVKVKNVGKECVITIENYGIGILPNEISNDLIFKENYQGALTKGEYRTGSGQGLSSVKEIIDKHNGRIQVESMLIAEDGSPDGRPHLTRFTIFLPHKQPKDTGINA
jgi:signal transduction histidine kinase